MDGYITNTVESLNTYLGNSEAFAYKIDTKEIDDCTKVIDNILERTETKEFKTKEEV